MTDFQKQDFSTAEFFGTIFTDPFSTSPNISTSLQASKKLSVKASAHRCVALKKTGLESGSKQSYPKIVEQCADSKVATATQFRKVTRTENGV